MANVFTSLAADIYKAADIVGRELVGLTSSCTMNAGIERAAKGDTVRSFFTRAQTVNTTYAPSMTIPEGTDQTVDNQSVALNSYASVQIPYTGEDIKHLNNGSGFETVYGDQVKQAFRTIVNKIELDGWNEARVRASRAYGTAGTTPFASGINELPNLRKVMVDNGMPFDGQVSLVMNTNAGVNLRSLTQLQKINESGTPELLRQGILSELQGFLLKESAGVGAVVAGTGTSYTTNTAGYAVGATVITLITGSGTVLAGDVVTFAGDTNKYVVSVGTAAAGAITLAAPGLRVAIPTSATAMTIGSAFTANIALHKAALELAIRPPAMPTNGDAAVDIMVVQDPWSGLTFDLAAYKGYQKMMIDVRCLYQWKGWKPDAITILLG